MSSMRNAVQRRNHRERGQPEERQKWGLLEKKKDYTARARDFNAKKKTLKALKAKVLEKNPDEFYFGMMSRKGPSTGKNQTGTVNGDRGNQVLSQEASRLYKTQDLGYIRTARNKAAKEVEDLEKRVCGIIGEGRKIVFADSQQEQLERLDADVQMDEDDEETDAITKKLRKMKEREADRLESKLAIARQRLKILTETEEALDLQRAKMNKAPSVGGVNREGNKFKVRERKK